MASWKKVECIREGIAVALTTRSISPPAFAPTSRASPSLFSSALCEAQPGAYALFLDFGDWKIASVSPELFFAWTPATGEIVTRPMKGTAPLEPVRRRFARLRERLRRESHDRGSHSQRSSPALRAKARVRVPELFTIENLATVRQMTSTIDGHDLAGCGPCQNLRRAFPMRLHYRRAENRGDAGDCRAWKHRRAEPIAERLAWCQPGGAALFSVGIRTVTIVNAKPNAALAAASPGISDPAEEYGSARSSAASCSGRARAFDLLESIKLEDGAFWLLDRHCERLQRAAEHFGFPFDIDAISRDAASDRRAASQTGAHAVRLLLSRRGNIKTETGRFPLRRLIPGWRSPQPPIYSDDEFLHHKTTHRAVYEASAPKSADIFDTLLFNERGEITEFTRGNVAMELDGRLVTPPESSGLLGRDACEQNCWRRES